MSLASEHTPADPQHRKSAVVLRSVPGSMYCGESTVVLTSYPMDGPNCPEALEEEFFMPEILSGPMHRIEERSSRDYMHPDQVVGIFNPKVIGDVAVTREKLSSRSMFLMAAPTFLGKNKGS